MLRIKQNDPELARKPQIYLVIEGYSHKKSYRVLHATETRRDAREHLKTVHKLYGFPIYESLDCYRASDDSYLKILPVDLTVSVGSGRRAKHPLSTGIVRG